MIEKQLTEFKNFIERIISLEEGGHMTDEEAWAHLKNKYTELKSERKKLRKDNKTIAKLDEKTLKKGLDDFQKKAK